MELKQKFKVVHTAYFASRDNDIEATDKEIDEFSLKLEDLMNEYKVTNVNAFLDPYERVIKIK